MDKDWFKRRLRMQGKTADDLAKAISRDRAVVSRIMNGHQPMTLDQAKIFATELAADVAEVLVRGGLTDAPVAQAIRPGFAESDAAAWVPGPGLFESAQVPTIAEALGGGTPGIDVWRVKSQVMALAGMLVGDFMLVDTHQSDRVKAGDLVIAQVYNRTGATTVLRRFEPPVLVSASADPAEGRVHVVDGINVVIRGKVMASWRV
jgi:hypothetical protein